VALDPGIHPSHLAFAGAGHADESTRVPFTIEFRFGGEKILDAELIGDGAGDEGVGRRHDGKSIATLAVLLEQRASALEHQRCDALVHEALPPGEQIVDGVVRQWLELKSEKLFDVELASAVLLEESRVRALVGVTLDDAEADEELAPQIVAVAGNQRVVEIEKRDGHGERLCNGRPEHSRALCRCKVVPWSAVADCTCGANYGRLEPEIGIPSGGPMIDSDGYRPNIGIILSNEQGQVLWARRTGQNAWQFPQGGIKAHEDPEQALYRELCEELGLQREHVAIMGSTRGWLRYRLPKRYIRRHCQPTCIGQKQVWYLLRFLGQENAVRLDTSHPQEFDRWKWVNYWHPSREVIFFKREVYRRALKELAPKLYTDTPRPRYCSITS